MYQFISGTFDDAEAANQAVDDILALDYPLDRITIVMNAQTRDRLWRRRAPDADQGESATSGPVVGQVSCDHIGAIVNNEFNRPEAPKLEVSGARTRLFVAGPAAVALESEGVVNYTPARLLRTLARFGMPRFDAERLERDIDSGGIVVGVITKAGDRVTFERVMQKNAARNVLQSMTT